jgi:hypothetical protein
MVLQLLAKFIIKPTTNYSLVDKLRPQLPGLLKLTRRCW